MDNIDKEITKMKKRLVANNQKLKTLRKKLQSPAEKKSTTPKSRSKK